ncbi:MAG TPA: hypothetical protein VLH60_00930, partial [Sedimentisphaerales bacterium]|nr:hypothetical protein [Sedimentisphaerales bacterium]
STFVKMEDSFYQLRKSERYCTSSVFGFIIAMYDSAKAIFEAYGPLSSDEKLVRLIYSRFVLYPGFSQRPLTLDPEDTFDPDALKWAEECYKEIKASVNRSDSEWDSMPLYEKFLEICVRVMIEETIVDTNELAKENPRQSPALFMPIEGVLGTRPVLAVAFKIVFSHVNWELTDRVKRPQADSLQRVILSPKKQRGPESRLKEYPYLYLYFDDFDEIRIAWNESGFEAARHDADIRSCPFSLEEIMRDENLFLRLYMNNLIRLRLWDGTVLCREEEEFYWDRANRPDKYADELSHLSDPAIIAETKKLLKKIDNVVAAIRVRHGLTDSHGL